MLDVVIEKVVVKFQHSYVCKLVGHIANLNMDVFNGLNTNHEDFGLPSVYLCYFLCFFPILPADLLFVPSETHSSRLC